MATLAQIYQIRFTTTGLLHRATASVMKLAAYILTTEDPGTANHANRVIWANQAVADPESKARMLLNDIACNGTIQGGYNPGAADEGVVDGDIDYVVGVSVNTYAKGV